MATTTRALQRLARSVAAILSLAALLAGLPWALGRFVGWPLPHVLPSWTEVTDALNGASISDAVLIKSLACAAWVLWLLLAASFVVEGSAWLRGREARDVPFARLLQPLVREMVVSATLLVGTLRPIGPTPGPPRSSPVATLIAVDASPAVEGVVETRSAATANAELPTCVVVPRDSLWELAEEHLGDGLRWREIWELNQGRMFPDGRHFLDPNLIRPGWVLAMPANSIGLEALVPSVPPVPVAVPAPPLQEAAVPAPEAPPFTPPVTQAPRDSRDPSADTSPADDPDFDATPLLAGSALLAAGVIACVSRLRRRQQRGRSPGRLIPMPDAQVARAEVHLRRAAAHAPFERVDLALRVLAHCLSGRKPGPCPAITAVSVGPDAIEILLNEPVSAPAGPFDVDADGRAWTLGSAVPDADLHQIADTQGSPAPALVTVGTIDERSVLVDLEAGARTLLGGDPADAEKLLWTLATDLATSNRADDLNVILVGHPPSGLDALDRVRVIGSLETAIDSIEAEAVSLTAALASNRRASTLDARVANPLDTITPTVVLVSSAVTPVALDRLLNAAGAHHGLAVVVAGDVGGDFDRELCVEDDTLIVKPVGLRLEPASLPADVLDATGELLQVATDLRPGEQLDLDLRPASPRNTDGLTVGPSDSPLEFDTAGQPILPAGHVLVRVLGPVEIVGGKQPIDRRRSIELVVYLALHPDGVDDSRLRTVLWPDAAPTQAAFNETVSRARRMLGLDPDGVHHLLPVDNRRYRVGRHVVTDSSVLEEHALDGCARDALRLVRGLPFEGTDRGYEWSYEEGQAHRLAALIDEARHRMERDGSHNGEPTDASLASVRAASSSRSA
jgi:hypothetical protein